MKKPWAVFKREYLQAVRKKSFLIMTVLMPFLFGALMIIPSALAVKGVGEKTVAVVDGTGRLAAAVAEGLRAAPAADPGKDAAGSLERPGRGRRAALPGNVRAEYVSAAGRDPKEAARPYLDRLHAEKPGERLDGVFVIPGKAFEDPSLTLTYYSRSSTDLIVQERLGRVVNRALERERLTGRGLNPAEIDGLLKDLRVDAVQLTKGGEEKKGGEMNFLVGFVFVLLIFIPVLIYGQEVMRGIIQEKTDRVVEILISSMTPFELLSGKILGMAAVGLTQIAIWVVMGGALAVYGATAAAAAGVNLGQFLRPVTRRLVLRLLRPRLPDQRLHLRGRRLDRELREGGPAGPRAGHHRHDASLVPRDADHHESRLGALDGPLPHPRLHADHDVHPDPRLRAAALAGRPLDRSSPS